MKANGHIVVLAVLFTVLVFALEKLGFWELAGLEHPNGLLYQGYLFLGFYFLMKTFAIQPYLNVFDARDELTLGKTKIAEDTKMQADTMLKDYESRLQAAKLQAIFDRERLLLEADTHEKNMLQEARDKARKLFELEHGKILHQKSEVQLELGSKTASLTQEILDQISGLAKPLNMGSKKENNTMASRTSS